jgi:4-carboxymuconolactone decarboxylase
MRVLIVIVMLLSVAAISSGQSAGAAAQGASVQLPKDIHPDSLSRLPLVKREQMDEEGKRVYDLVAGRDRTTPLLGPGGISFHSPGVAEPMHMLNQYLRNGSLIKGRYFELSAIVAAREIDQSYEWSGHEPASLRVGIEQSVIDVVKYDKDVTGLDPKDSAVIRFGRALLRDHKVSSELFAEMVGHFGNQGTFEVAAAIADYTMAGMLLNAVDHHIPAGRNAAVLPPR